MTTLVFETLFDTSKSKPERILLINSDSGIKAFSLLSEGCEFANQIQKIAMVDPQKNNKEIVEMGLQINRVSFKKRKKVVAFEGNPSYVLATMMSEPKNHQYDFIDIDSKGSPLNVLPDIWPLFDPKNDGNVLGLTFSDSRVLCGIDIKKQMTRYQSSSLKNLAPHESAMRLAMLAVAKSAVQYGFSVEPLVSFNGDYMKKFYLRVSKIKPEQEAPSHSESFFLHCNECHFTKTATSLKATEKCVVCDSKLQRFGPFYGKRLANPSFLEDMLKRLESKGEKYITKDKIEEILVFTYQEATFENQMTTPINKEYLTAFFMTVPISLDFIK
jgi:tRNA G26 N,N-dimethylase Trm1